jgi:hypothetical protein
VRKNYSEMREWRKREREIGAMLTDSLLAQGFSKADIAHWGPEAWHWVDGEEVQGLVDDLANHFGDTMVIRFLIRATSPQRAGRPGLPISRHLSNAACLAITGRLCQ